MIDFTLATEEHARAVQQHLRDVDRREVAHMGGAPATSVEYSLSKSLIAWTMLRDGRPIAVFGVGPIPQRPGEGCVWLLGTPELQHAGKSLVQKGHYYVGLMLRLFPRGLHNAIDTDNKRTRRWLRALGFTEGKPFTAPSGHPFVLIHKVPNV